jgi:hypothetical protein
MKIETILNPGSSSQMSSYVDSADILYTFTTDMLTEYVQKQKKKYYAFGAIGGGIIGLIVGMFIGYGLKR